jgi:phenylacetate-CoA ligase
MDLGLIARYLVLRRQLRARERWSPDRLRVHQENALRGLRAHAMARSPFYRRFHAGLEDRPLPELPVLTKAELMANFDNVVTDREIRLADVEAHLAEITGDERFRRRYRVVSTSGTTGLRGIFLSDPTEWAHVIASYARAQEWAGIVPSLRRPVRLAVVSTTKPWHQSARVGASVRSPLAPTLRLAATDPMPRTVDQLNAFQPASLVAYASMQRLLAEEQLGGRLNVGPQAVMSASEVLTADTRRRINDAWGIRPFDVYAATEPAGIASECEQHAGLHLYEDLVITEVVDENNSPVPPGTAGAKILISVLFSRTQPLIRYELSDSVVTTDRRCPCGRTFGLIEAIQGRREDVIHLSSPGGGSISIHPNVFHDVLDRVSAGEWQIVQDVERIQLLVARPGADFDGTSVLAEVARAVAASGAYVPQLSWAEVDAIPRTGTGKAPLIRAATNHAPKAHPPEPQSAHHWRTP